MALSRQSFEAWLSAYGEAWRLLSAEAYLRLFSADIAYYWTPFDAPTRGHDQLREALQSTLDQQEEPDFGFDIITVDGATGWAHWTCSFTRKGTDDPVRVDGILKARFENGVCREFREWRHRLEPGQGDLMRDFDA